MPKKAFMNLPPETREEILQKTIRLYTERPFEEITLQVLLDTLSLHPATFYRYFSDKDELYLYAQVVLTEKIYAYEREKDPDYELQMFTYREKNEFLSEVESRFLMTGYELPKDMLLRAHLEVFKDMIFRQYREAIRKLRAEGKLYDDIDDDLIAYMYATTTLNLNLFFREFHIEDPDLRNHLKKNFYQNFFGRGLLKDPNGKEDA